MGHENVLNIPIEWPWLGKRLNEIGAILSEIIIYSPTTADFGNASFSRSCQREETDDIAAVRVEHLHNNYVL